MQQVEVPIPSPNKDEILIKMEAASINPLDWKIQKRILWPILPAKFPYIPCNSLDFHFIKERFEMFRTQTYKNIHLSIGMDVAGEVMEVGKGVTKFKAGDKVVGLTSPFVSFFLLFFPLH